MDMIFQERVRELLEKVYKIRTDSKADYEGRLPENCWFISDDEVVCFDRKYGDSRYPYEQDGLQLWAYASGGLQILEGGFNIVLDSFFGGNVPKLSFFAGRKEREGYFPNH